MKKGILHKRRKHYPSICSEALKAIMYERGITVKKMAEDLNICSQTIYKWQYGDRIPRLDVALEIADYLNVDINVLCGR